MRAVSSCLITLLLAWVCQFIRTALHSLCCSRAERSVSAQECSTPGNKTEDKQTEPEGTWTQHRAAFAPQMLICALPALVALISVFWGENMLQLCLCLLVWRQQQIELGWGLNLGIVMSWFWFVKWRFLARLRSGWTVIRQIRTEINHNSSWDHGGCWQGAAFLKKLGMTLSAGGWVRLRRPGCRGAGPPLLQRRSSSSSSAAASGISKRHNELFTFSPQREPAR